MCPGSIVSHGVEAGHAGEKWPSKPRKEQHLLCSGSLEVPEEDETFPLSSVFSQELLLQLPRVMPETTAIVVLQDLSLGILWIPVVCNFGSRTA